MNVRAKAFADAAHQLTLKYKDKKWYQVWGLVMSPHRWEACGNLHRHVAATSYDDRTVNFYDRSNPFADRNVPSVELKDEVTNSPRTADTSPQRTRRF